MNEVFAGTRALTAQMSDREMVRRLAGVSMRGFGVGKGRGIWGIPRLRPLFIRRRPEEERYELLALLEAEIRAGEMTLPGRSSGESELLVARARRKWEAASALNRVEGQL